MDAKNIDAFEDLIARYNSIDLAEIEGAYEKEPWEAVPAILTGFGTVANCTLCRSLVSQEIFIRGSKSPDCDYCVYGATDTVCDGGCNLDTYDAIYYALDPEELLEAYQNRAAHMQEILNEYKSKGDVDGK